VIEEQAWEAACALLERSDDLALACHVGPDGDALGSMLAFGLAMRARGANVVASFPDPFLITRTLRFLPGQDLLVEPSHFPATPRCMVAFDAGTLDRLGSLVPAAQAATDLLVVDHHASGTPYGTHRLVDTDAAATAVIVHDLLARLGAPLDADIATGLYTGLVTDTGRFSFRSTTPQVHAIAASLLEAGVDQDAVARELYATEPIGYLKVAGRALERIAPHAGDAFVYTWISREDMETAGITPDEVDGVMDLVRKVDSHDVAVVLKEQKDGVYRVSMRSKGATDVGAICQARGGGGHRLAAGYTSKLKDPGAVADEIAAGFAT
jgi:bifunctional oligoribonuclease and PAP phosphatase NrnA